MFPRDIKQTLQILGGGPNKALGQHFLIDRLVLGLMHEAAELHAGDQVLEIGPGLGVLTQELLEAGTMVRAIEQDRRYVGYLEQRFSPYRSSFRVIYGDAARLEWSCVLEQGCWKLVSNLPYSITSLVLRKALWSALPPTRLVVLIQREVAERVVARDGKTSLLSLMVALSCSEYHIIKRVPAGAFFPPPKVESAILQLTPWSWHEREEQWGIHIDQVMQVARRGFAHPRKQLASNLHLNIEQKRFLGEVTGSEKVRAEDLSPMHWVCLTKTLK